MAEDKPDKPLSNFLLPKHELIPADDRSKILKEHSMSLDSMPKIRMRDPAIAGLGAKYGDIIKIMREDITGKNIYYRLVIGTE